MVYFFVSVGKGDISVLFCFVFSFYILSATEETSRGGVSYLCVCYVMLC